MDGALIQILTQKPVLVGLHLVFGIVGIDGFLWAVGELSAKSFHRRRTLWAAAIGAAGFVISWLIGGYYYVKYYGVVVKPIIKAGLAPWAHAIFMETKEHIFLFIVPVALTILLLIWRGGKDFAPEEFKRVAKWLAGLVVFLGLAVGLMGFIVSAAARWGAL